MPATARSMFLGLPAAALVLAMGAYAGQRAMLFRAADFDPAPARWEASDFEVVRYRTADGLDLDAWYAPPTRPDAPVILYFPGCQGHLGLQSAKLRAFVAGGAGVLMAGYRGYAGNPGRPSEAGLRRDAAAAAAFLHGEGVDPARTVVWGYSLGTALAAGTAVAGGYAGLVLEAPFESIPAVVESHAPFGLGPLIWDRFDTRAILAGVDSEVLILHGRDDRVIPWHQGAALSRIAARAEFRLYDGAGHADLPAFGALRAVAGFVDRVVASPSG